MDLLCCHNYEEALDLASLAERFGKTLEEVPEWLGEPCHSRAVTISHGFALCQKHFTMRVAEGVGKALAISGRK